MKTFVANRVNEIQAATKAQDWFHVPAQDNPADLISRGQNPQDFINNRLWVHGPQCLSNNSATWPRLSFQNKEIPDKRAESFNFIVQANSRKNKTRERHSNSFQRFQKVKISLCSLS